MVIDGFYDHAAKLEAAATGISQEGLRVGREASKEFRAASADDWKVRLDAMFVEWVSQAADGLEGKWRWGVRTDAEILAKSIQTVQERLSRAAADWT